MNAAGIFISHTTADDAIVAEIRETLEGQGLTVWVDSRELTGGDDLEDEVFEQIEAARHFMVVLSPGVINSTWVDKEIKHALKVQKDRSDGYKVIPILLDGVERSALRLWFGNKEPLAVRIGSGHDAVAKALPELLAALGKRLPSDSVPDPDITAAPSANLTLKLNNLTMPTAGGQRRAKATATLIYRPPTQGARTVESLPYKLTAALGPIEDEELTWYLERYSHWPVGVFAERADKVVKKLPEWGGDLFKAALRPDAAREAYEAWKRVGGDTAREDRHDDLLRPAARCNGGRRFSVVISPQTQSVLARLEDRERETSGSESVGPLGAPIRLLLRLLVEQGEALKRASGAEQASELREPYVEAKRASEQQTEDATEEGGAETDGTPTVGHGVSDSSDVAQAGATGPSVANEQPARWRLDHLTSRFDSELPRRMTNAGSRRTIGQSVDVGRRSGRRLPLAAVQRRKMLSRLHPHNPLQL